jgi:hypothetical protein
MQQTHCVFYANPFDINLWQFWYNVGKIQKPCRKITIFIGGVVTIPRKMVGFMAILSPKKNMIHQPAPRCVFTDTELASTEITPEMDSTATLQEVRLEPVLRLIALKSDVCLNIGQMICITCPFDSRR